MMSLIVLYGLLIEGKSLMYVLLSLEWLFLLLLLELLPGMVFSSAILFLMMAVSSSIVGLLLFMKSLSLFGAEMSLF